MKVSVIIPNYNYARFLPAAVESVLAQTYTNVEVIVVDDGSTDDSLAVLSRYNDNIRLVEQENAGVCIARNRGVKESSGELVAFLDADDVWLPEKLEKQIEAYGSDPNTGLIHVGVQDIDAEGGLLEHHVNGLSGWVADEILMFRGPVILGGGSGFMVPKELFHKAGGFDPQLSTSADWDFCYRVSRLAKTKFIADILLKYRLHGANMHGNIPRMELEMLLAFEKAFAEDDAEVQRLRRRAYGNLHRVLAGSYLHAGDYGQFLRHSVKSLVHRPAGIAYFAAYPFRRLSRRKN